MQGRVIIFVNFTSLCLLYQVEAFSWIHFTYRYADRLREREREREREGGQGVCVWGGGRGGVCLMSVWVLRVHVCVCMPAEVHVCAQVFMQTSTHMCMHI